MGLIPWLGRSPGGGHSNPLQYSCLKIPWTEEPGGLQSMGSQRVGHDWSYLAHMHVRMHTHTHTHIHTLTLFSGEPWLMPGNPVAPNHRRPCLPCLYNTDHDLPTTTCNSTKNHPGMYWSLSLLQLPRSVFEYHCTSLIRF